MMRGLRPQLPLTAMLLLVGCGGPPKKEPPPPGPAQVTLGGTAIDGTGFQPMAGDQTLVPGAQGGMHVWLKYRVAGMAPGTVHVHREVHRVSDHAPILIADGTLEVGAAGSDGYWELPMALPSFMCPTPIGISVIDQTVVFDVTMTAEDGAPLGSGTAEATVRCPSGDQAAFCARICSG